MYCVSNKEVTRTDCLVSFLEYHSPNAFLESTDFDIHVGFFFFTAVKNLDGVCRYVAEENGKQVNRNSSCRENEVQISLSQIPIVQNVSHRKFNMSVSLRHVCP